MKQYSFCFPSTPPQISAPEPLKHMTPSDTFDTVGANLAAASGEGRLDRMPDCQGGQSHPDEEPLEARVNVQHYRV